jgi:hypothetical protein
LEGRCGDAFLTGINCTVLDHRLLRGRPGGVRFPHGRLHQLDAQMPVGSGLPILNGGTLTHMADAPYDNERVTQPLLAEHPEILPGGATDPR